MTALEQKLVRLTVNRFDRDEAIVTLNRLIKGLQFENGFLKSELAECKHELKEALLYKAKGIGKFTIRDLQQHILNLEHQLLAHNIPIPKKN